MLIVRAIDIQEIDAAINVTQQVAKTELLQYGNEQEVDDWLAAIPESRQRIASDPRAIIMLAILDGQPIATGFAQKREHILYIGGTYSISPGRGAGSRIIQHLLDWGNQDKDSKLVEVAVFAKSKSASFWSNLGLEEIDKQIDPAGFFKQAYIIQMQGCIELALDTIRPRS